MGLYLKATNFLETSDPSSATEGFLKKFLKGKSLLKSVVNEEIDHGEIRLDSDDLITKETELPLSQIEEKLELPDELKDDVSIILYEEDEIILDKSKFFNDEGIQFIEPKLKVDLDESEKSEEPKILSQESDLSNEEDNKTSDYIQDVEIKLQYYNLLKDILKELIASSTINEFFDNLLYSIEGQLGSKYILIFSSINEMYEQYEIVAFDGIELSKNYLLSTESSVVNTLISQKDLIFSKDIESENNQQEKEFMFLSENEMVIPFILDDKLIGFIILGVNESSESYSSQEIEFLKMLIELASSVLFRFYEQEKVQKQLTDSNISKIKIELLNTFYIQSALYMSTDQLMSAYIELLKALEADLKLGVYIQESREVYKLAYETDLGLTKSFKYDEIFVKELKNTKKSLTLSDTEEIERLGLGKLPVIINPGLENDELYSVIIIPKEFEELVETDIVTNSLIVVHSQLIRLIKERRLKEMAKNPLSLIEDILISELVDAQKKSETFSLIIIKIQNSGRIIQTLGSEFYLSYSDYVYSVIYNNAGTEDDIFRIGKSKHCLFLKGRDSTFTKEFIEDLKNKVNEYPYTPKDFKIISHVYSLDFPEQSVETRKFMELLEEA